MVTRSFVEYKSSSFVGHFALAVTIFLRYIRQYNKTPKPVKWIYRNTTNHITTIQMLQFTSYAPLRVQNQR
jgi:hypothetical protein